MAKGDRYSRFNPAYLFRRHAGTVFLFLAAGLFAGVAYHALLQPAHYGATAEATASVVPGDSGERVDWTAKQESWNAFLAHPGKRGLLGSNLRHALKLAVTAGSLFDTERFSAALAAFGEGASYSAALYPASLAFGPGPKVTVTRRDLAENMDFQSLAAIVADLVPAPDAEGWDFSFFPGFLPRTPEEDAIAAPDAAEPFLRVLFTLHRLLGGGDAPLEEAWRSARTEVSVRLEREARFAGGGGFGTNAKRELMREMAAIPALAANALYTAAQWHETDAPARGTTLDVTGTGGTAVLRAASGRDLRPLEYPRDTVFTRTPALAAATLLATIAASERHEAVHPHELPPAPAAPKTAEAPAAPGKVAAAPDPIPEQTPEAPPPAKRILDAAADKLRLDAVAAAEDALRLARRDRDACLRRLAAAREDEARLALETLHARERADRLRERLDQAALLVEAHYEPEIPDETRALLRKRDEVTRRLNDLLDYCTVEHPFVKAAFRDLEAIEATLARHRPNPNANALAERRAVRAADIQAEWEAANAEADSLEERRVDLANAVLCLADEAEAIECAITERETALAAAERVPVPFLAAPARAPEPQPEPESEPETAPPPPAPPPPPEEKKSGQPVLDFSPAPSALPLRAGGRALTPLWAGLAAGLVAGMIAAAARELLSRRFATPGEARRMVKLPVLASLPAYDPASFKKAAATVKGDLALRKGGGIHFIPTPVELFEPPPEARRGRVTPLKRRPRVLVWVCGLLLAGAAAALFFLSAGGFAQPRAPFRGELPLPAATVPAWAEELAGAQEWGDMP